MKVCSKCRIAKPVSEYTLRKTWRPGTRVPQCNACRLVYSKAYRAKHAEKVRAQGRKSNLKTRHGVTPEWYATTLAAQGNGCAICASPPDGRWRRHPIDHDHATGRVRGVLCNRCNRGLGLFSDSADRLQAAAEYLRSHK